MVSETLETLRSTEDPSEFEACLEASLAGDLDPKASARLAAVLRERARVHDNERTGYIAGEALQGLAGLALADPAAHQLELTMLLRDAAPDDDPAYALQAARIAGLLYAHWTDQSLRGPLRAGLEALLEHPDAGGDAEVELAHARLIDALDSGAAEEIAAGLEEAQQRFEAAAEEDEERVDARFMAAVLQAVRGFSLGADPENVKTACTRAGAVLDERRNYGRPEALPATSRRASEQEWGTLIQTISDLAGAVEQPAWLRGDLVVGKLIDAVEQSRSVLVAPNLHGDLGPVVTPRLVAPLARFAQHRSQVAQALVELELTDEKQLIVRELLHEAEPPKADGPEGIVNATLGPDAAQILSTYLDEAQYRQAERQLEDVTRQPVEHRDIQWHDAFNAVVDALDGHPDFAGEMRGRIESLVAQLLDFLSTCLRVELGFAAGAYGWLGKADAKESEMADALHLYLVHNSAGTVNAEVRHHGDGGRVDILVTWGAERFVIECKRDEDPTAIGQLDPYLSQTDRYMNTSLRIGALAVLDLKDKKAGPVRGLDSRVWVAKVDSADPAVPERQVITVLIPGNRASTPAAVGKATPRG